jgi:zinc transport system substrate-binding protein
MVDIELRYQGSGNSVKMVRILVKIALFGLFILIMARSGHAMERMTVFVSIVPQKYFVQQIGKDLVDVHVMVQPGMSPATYEPKPKQMAVLSKTKVYFAIGVPFENVWLEKIAAANPKMKVVHTDHGIEKIPMAAHHHHEEGKRHDEENHEHGILDPHIWLSPPLVKILARTMLAAFKEIDPYRRTVYEANCHKFISRIDALDAQFKAIFAGKEGLQIMVFHPEWGYFSYAYGLNQAAIEIEGKEPKPARLKKLIEHAREKGIKVVFVQPQFSSKSAEIAELVAKEIGGQVAFANPLAEDWMANLREVADKFKAAMR